MAELLLIDDLPEGWMYPPSFVRVVELGIANLEPWHLLFGKTLRERFLGVKGRYPTRTLIPFARRQDNDDVACFDVDAGDIAIVHDFASPGWEQRERFGAFYDWLQHAVSDLVEFDT